MYATQFRMYSHLFKQVDVTLEKWTTGASIKDKSTWLCSDTRKTDCGTRVV